MCVAFSALALAGWLFAPQIADGLVVRGDDFMYRNAPKEAMRRYERALLIDNRNAAAADRIAFVGMQMRTPQSLRRAVNVATAYLANRPNDAVILADRALCYLIERRYAPALTDFQRAGTLQRDPRYFVFAGWAASHEHDRRHARALWRMALAIDPHDIPARSALDRWR
jgi:tetratricopeptide (TPR) repeat protein